MCSTRTELECEQEHFSLLLPFPPDLINHLCSFQVNRFQKSIILIVQYNYLKSCSGDFILQNSILCTRACSTGFITQSSWGFHFHLTIMSRWKCFVSQLYKLRRGISGGPALKYFYMIHRGGLSLPSFLSLSLFSSSLQVARTCLLQCVAVSVAVCCSGCCSVLQ